MYTPTNAYYSKFSSGTIVALLALSGLLVMVPLATSVHATNPSLPTITVTVGAPIPSGASTAISFKLTNPAGNTYAITGFNLVVPSGWTLTTCTGGLLLQSATSSGTSCQYGVGSGAAINPGSSDTLGVKVTAAAPSGTNTYPYSGSFTSTVQDASSAAFYAGPSFSVQVMDPTTAIAVTDFTSATFVAGSSALTMTATVTCTTGTHCPGGVESGLPVTWGLTGTTGYASGSYTLTASSNTGSNGVATATFAPSNKESDATKITATVGTSAVTAATASTLTTAPGTPSAVSFKINAAAFPSTYYIATDANDGFATPSWTSAKMSAEIKTSAAITVSVSDRFGNTYASGIGGTVANPFTISIQAIAGAGAFDNGGTAGLTTVDCTATTGPGVTCTTATGTGVVAKNYFQSYTYATVGKLSATISGVYASSPFTVGGSSGNIYTSTEATALTVSPSAPATIAAGKTATVYSNLTGSAQPGVPITLSLCVHTACSTTSAGYSGSFTTGGNTVTANSALGATSTTSSIQAKYSVATTLGKVAIFNATAPAPTNANSKATLAYAFSSTVTTKAGAASSLVIGLFYDTADADAVGTSIVAGLTLYVDVSLSDGFGNTVTNTSPNQIQITLTPSAGVMSATNVYITSGASDTKGSFGPIAWTLPSSGTSLNLKASGVVGGVLVSNTATMTVVSATPTFSVTTPAPLKGVIYSNTGAVVFRGWANASVGYDPVTTNIASIGYKINGGAWQSASITAANTVNSAIAVFLGAGLSTVQFNATDSTSAGNTVVSSTNQVLVDSAAPVAGFTTKNNANVTGGSNVTAWIYDTEGDLNASSVTVHANGTALASSHVAVTGTNVLGQNTTYAISISGLTTGKWVLTLDGMDYSGNAATTASITVHVTVPFSQSFTVSGTPSSCTLGGFSGVCVNYQNLNPTSQSVVVFAVFKNSAGQTAGIGSGSATFAAGSTQSVFIANPIGLASGTYSVNLFVFTTGNLPVSVSTTISVTV